MCELWSHVMGKIDLEGDVVLQIRCCPSEFEKLFETMQGEMIGIGISGCLRALMGPTGEPGLPDHVADTH